MVKKPWFLIIFLFVSFFVFIPLIYLESKSFVYFSPDHKPTEKLLVLIRQAKRKIHAAVYMITDHQIAQALVDAKARGVDVQMIVDTSTVDLEYGKGTFLRKNNIDIFVFREQTKSGKNKSKSKYKSSKNSRYGALMHNKFALIDNQLWTGSFNWTKNANMRNQENVVLTDDQEIYQPFEEQFKVILERCEKLESIKNHEPETPDSWFYFEAIKSGIIDFLKSFRKFLRLA